MSLLFLDFCNFPTQAKAIQKDIYGYDGSGVGATAFGYYYATDPNPAGGFTGGKVHGLYFDLFSGGGNLSLYQAAPALVPNGNNGDWERKKAEFASEVRDFMRLQDPDFYTSTENCEEGLIGAMDVLHIGQIGEIPPNDWGQFCAAFNIVYSRYQCTFDLAIALNDGALVGFDQDFFYASWVNAAFHFTSGHFSLNNGVRANGSWLPIVPINPPGLGTCGVFITLLAIKSIIAKMDATPVIRDYMRRGLRQRPLPMSWEGDCMASGRPLSSYLAHASGDTNIYTSTSIWTNPDADAHFASESNNIGIVLTSVHTDDVPYTIYMDSEAYGLDPTRTHILYSRVGNTRTELARFTDLLDYEFTSVFDFLGAHCVLLEVVTP